jgi:DNA-binding winged helix-turn-helix (wHTH) protein
VTVRFGDCVFDPDTRELLRAGKSVHLPAKTFRLLEVLLEQRPSAISKEKLMETLWPKTFVADGNLARLVAELREAIGDDARDPSLIRTIHGFGYAFQADARAVASRPRATPKIVLKLIWGDREIALGEGENVLGRDPLALVCVDIASVSRHHARILVEGDRATLEDLGSKNGTFRRGQRLKTPELLHDGDEIRIGTVPMVFRRFEAGGTTESARSR